MWRLKETFFIKVHVHEARGLKNAPGPDATDMVNPYLVIETLGFIK
jgi:hypothetical protein